MAFQTRDEAQDKVSRKVDRVLNKKKKHVPLGEESWDDLHTTEMHLPVNRTVKLVINEMDVIHDVGLSHFRMKMDAVPGIPTTMWFTPQYTTEQMKKRTGNPNFVYEISCDQMCGKGHFSMRGVIIVESEEDYKKWLASQKPEYFTLFPDKDPSKQVQAVDTTAATSKPMAQVMSTNP
jgi:cytochrome c oxidase subunit 2